MMEKQKGFFRDLSSIEWIDRIDKKRLIMGAKKRWMWIVASTVLFAALGGMGTYHFLTTYRAEAILVFQKDENKSLPGGIPISNVNLVTAMDMVTVPSNLMTLTKLYNLKVGLKDLYQRIRVSPPRVSSDLIRVEVSDKNPEKAVRMANSLAEIAVKNCREFSRNQLRDAIANYADQLNLVTNLAHEHMAEIETFKQTHPHFEFDEKSSSLMTQLNEAKKELQSVTLSYNQQMVEYENLKGEVERPLAPSLDEEPENPNVNSRIHSLEVAIADAKLKYAKQNPKLRVMEQELTDLRRIREKTQGVSTVSGSYLNTENLSLEVLHMQGRVRAQQKTMQDLQVIVQKLENDVQSLPREQMEFLYLLQTKEIFDGQVRFLRNAIESTRLLLNSPRNHLHVYQEASTFRPLKDSWWVPFLPFVSAFFGLCFGFALTIGREVFSSVLCTPEEIRMYYTIPPLMVIPEISLISDENMRFFMRELHHQIPDQKIITFLSALHGEGKSTLSIHFATYLAKMGKKVLYLSLDSENSQPGKTSLAGFFQGNFAWEQVKQSGEFDSAVPLDGEVIEEEFLYDESTWKECLSGYDHVIIDTPEITSSNVGPLVTRRADVSLLVIGALMQKQCIDDALSVLERYGASVKGILLNQVDPHYIVDQRIHAEIRRSR
ncbi:MAG: hypothetical protein KDK65_03810 [Chlamydiia bacterium]|nr:hypothetical protein [Chlamydiia bacterium]